jgi:hypothetical protein
VYHYADSEE